MAGSKFLFLVGGIGFLTALATAYGLAFQEWELLASWYAALSMLILALDSYGAIVWLIAHTAVLAAQILGGLIFHDGQHGC